jgi:hypothetical protein
LEFTGWPIAAINRASLLFTASLWQAAVMVSCASPRIIHGATAESGNPSMAMSLVLMATHFARRPSLFSQRPW